jgi:hypothetical protein
MAIKMAVVIVLGVWAGRKLDGPDAEGVPVFTLILSLLSVVAAIYLAIKEIR